MQSIIVWLSLHIRIIDIVRISYLFKNMCIRKNFAQAFLSHKTNGEIGKWGLVGYAYSRY